MTLVLAIVAIVWLGVALLAVALCRAAALGDRRQAPEAVRPGVVEAPPPLRVASR